MSRFKIIVLIFTAVFVISAAVLFFFIKQNMEGQPGTTVSPPAWVNENGSSGMHPVSGKVVRSGAELNRTEQDKESNATAPAVQGSIQENATPGKSEAETKAEAGTKKIVEELRKNIITEVFLDNLASYIADSYQPAGSLPFKPVRGYSSASFKGINTHFGLNLNGLMPEAKSLSTARAEIWSELLSPGVLTQLSETYGPPLLDLIEEKGIMTEREFIEGDAKEVRGLTSAQRAEMFRASAQPLHHAASVLAAIAENKDLLQALEGYFKAEKHVDIANGIFQADLNQSQNSGSVTARNKAEHSGKVLKDAITVREKIKTGITKKIQVLCPDHKDSADDYFYIAKWLYRRTRNNDKAIKSIQNGCSILNGFAEQLEKRADLIEKTI
ncbi:hypothetical protein [Maridesulfovibrio sp.]|uniref:hypothetical protein n=1 Tax=Maridesulfovibrio sp. TaxID=2795000 RepID=UPI002A18CD24|nr:hypothetical protein [Maridesulfovibrio sp.]